MLNKSKLDFPVLNVASGLEITIGEVVEKFINILGYDSSIIKFSGEVRKGDPQNWKADIFKLKELGYNPQYSLEHGLKQYAQWLKK